MQKKILETLKKPNWLNKRIDYHSMKIMGDMFRSLQLNTVCESARCPNMGECFKQRTATFLILGGICTRNCQFCAIESGTPELVDDREPENLLIAAKELNLKHVVITSVTRDDLIDGGATQFAKCIYKLREELPTATIEVLTPDFKGNTKALDIIIKAKPEIFNHNLETIADLYPYARPMANYIQSLSVLEYVKKNAPSIFTKSGIMLGLGENEEEVIDLFDDLRNVDCDILTIGQYLPPSKAHVKLKEYISIEKFENYKKIAMTKGFKYVASGPYVRSSYHAFETISELQK